MNCDNLPRPELKKLAIDKTRNMGMSTTGINQRGNRVTWTAWLADGLWDPSFGEQKPYGQTKAAEGKPVIESVASETVEPEPEAPKEPGHQLAISVVKNVHDNSPKLLNTDWTKFCKHFEKPDVRGHLPLEEYFQAEKSIRDSQKDGEGIICGSFKTPGTRNKDDLAALYLEALDLDDSVLSFEEVCAKLEGFECLVHTSYSHHPEKPRIRVYLPLTEPITTDIEGRLESIIDFLNDRLGGHVAPESKKPAQLYFTAAVPPGGEGYYQCRVLSGVMIDPADFPEIPAQEKVKEEYPAAGDRPGDDYNQRGSWDDLLLPLGWKYSHTSGGNRHYTRPGKARGISLTVFSNGVAYCHTSAPEAAPFEGGKGYTLFTAYALIHHKGDHSAAAAELRRQGYGGDSSQENSGASASADTADWPEPVPLPEGLTPVLQLDSSILPEPLRPWLLDMAERMGIPPDYSAAAAMTSLGAVIGRGCGIYPKQRDSWLVVPNTFGGVVGRPSLLKTPSIAEAMRPLDRLEIEAKADFKAAEQSFEIGKMVSKAKKEELEKQIRQLVKDGKEYTVNGLESELAGLALEEPSRRRFCTSDGTPERIIDLLNQNPRGIMIKRDELVGFMRGLDKEGREGARALFLEGWNGTGRYSYDTISRGTVDVEALTLSVFGAVTPGPLSDYVYSANRGGGGDDGLLQRFQLLVWPDPPATWKQVDRWPDSEQRNRAYEIFKALAGDIPGALVVEGESIPALRFSTAGQVVFNEWRTELEHRLLSRDITCSALESHLAKYRSLMPSLALIIHLVDVVAGIADPGPVSEKSALMAVGWCEYLESHAARIYSGGQSPPVEAARELLKKIRQGAVKDGTPLREIWRHQWSRLSSSDEVAAACRVLADYDWLMVERRQTGGRPSELIHLNPRLKI